MTRRYPISILLPLVGVFLLLGGTVRAQQGDVRTVNLSPDSPALDFFIGDTTRVAVANLPYGSASASLTRTAGLHRLIATQTGMTMPRAIDAIVQLDTARRINVLAVNSFTQIEAFTIAFNLARQPVADSAYVRLVNGAAGLGGVDVRLKDASGAVRTFSAFSFKSNTQFFAIPPGETEVWFLTPGSGTIVKKFKGTVPGNIYASIIFSGQDGGSLKVHLLTETSTTLQNPMMELGSFVEPPASALRVVHAVSDGPAIDIYLNDTIAAQFLNYRDASPQVALDSGNYSVGVTIAGQPLGNAVLNTTLDLNKDTAYMVVASGSLLGAKLNVLTLKRRMDMAATDSTILLRLLHTGFDLDSLDFELTDAKGNVIRTNGLAFETWTGYSPISAGKLHVRVTRAGSSRPVFVGDGTLDPGSIVTVMVTQTGGVGHLHALIESDANAQQPMYEFMPTGRGAIRFVHVSPDAPSVEAFFYNDTLDKQLVNFRGASGLVNLDSGDVNVKVAAQGLGIGSAILSGDIAVKPLAITTLYAVGAIVDQTLDTLTLETSFADSPPQGKVSIRLLHACPDCGPLDVGMTFGTNPTQGYNDLAFKAHTEYVIVPSGRINVKLYENGAADSILDVSGSLEPDQVVTAVVSGRKTDGSLGVNLLFDASILDQRPMTLLSNITTSVDRDEVAEGVTIAPNPAHGFATISYTLATTASPRISLYNSVGRLVAVIEPGAQGPGRYNAGFSTSLLPAGAYTTVITVGAEMTPGGTLVVR